MENIFLLKKVSIYKILININEQDTSFLNCKHKHMIQCGAVPDKVGVLHHLLPIEFHGSQAELISEVYLSLVPGLISFC